jgi:uncharacterized membrane protein YqgA involved in biofilm formation
MPESRNRHKHHLHHQAPHHAPAKPKRSAALVLAILAAILGLGVAFFAQDADALWMIIGAVSGAVIGYIVGHNMDKAIEKNK